MLTVFNLNGLIYAQPEIVEKFSIDLTEASWALSAYALTFGSFLLLAGRAGRSPLTVTVNYISVIRNNYH
jgi:hypothetical protein